MTFLEVLYWKDWVLIKYHC